MPARSVDGGVVDASGVAASVGDDELSGIGIVSDGVVDVDVGDVSVALPDAQAASAAVATTAKTSARVRRPALTD